jgi:hypothetical protein
MWYTACCAGCYDGTSHDQWTDTGGPIAWSRGVVIHTTHQQQFIINVQAGAVGDQVVGPHELTEISHGLTKPPEDVPLAQHECGTPRAVPDVLMAPHMTNGQTQEDALRGLAVW